MQVTDKKAISMISLAAAAAATLALAPAASAQEAPGKKKLAITKIAPTEALAKSMAKQGVSLSIDSVLQALDSQVYDRMLNTRRFEILERSDADALAKEGIDCEVLDLRTIRPLDIGSVVRSV